MCIYSMIMIYTLDTWTRFAKMAIYCLRWVTRKVINNSLACKKREDEAKVVAEVLVRLWESSSSNELRCHLRPRDPWV